MRELGWRRLWVPSYMCQHVIETLVHTGIPCVSYDDAPTQAGPTPGTLSPEHEDAVLLVNYFGLRDAGVEEALTPSGATLIVDHTHDLLSTWAFDGRADFALASLRKTLPTPDGGVLWSPNGHPLPQAPEVSRERAMAAHAKWKAMRLKGHYLKGEPVSKADFRALAADGEAGIAAGPISGISPPTQARLSHLPLHSWRAKRQANHDSAREALADAPGLRVLKGSRESCPFSLFIVFESREARERVRQALIQAHIYPAVLWPMSAAVLPEIPTSHRELGETSLSLHCDMRYDAEDMLRVARVIREAVPR